jgi:hypothetical protein
MDEAAIRELACRIIQREGIPNRPPDRLWGGYGTGLPCAICGLALRSDEIEFEIEFFDSTRLSPLLYHLHDQCFSVWELEREKR